MPHVNVYVGLIHFTMILCRKGIFAGSIAWNPPLPWKDTWETWMSFQQMATKMTLASVNVQVPTIELILQKLQHFKLLFSLEIMNFATIQCHFGPLH